MAKTKKTHDIFLSYPFDLSSKAKAVVGKFEQAGLVVFAVTEATPDQDILQEMWQALAESWAVVAVVKPKMMSPNVAVEIGAAAAWQKPVYILTTGEVTECIDVATPQYHVFPISEIDAVVHAIIKTLKPLDEKGKETLVKAYVEIGIPTDQLLREPAAIDRLNKIMWAKGKLKLSGERIMQELLRLRKKGKLPRAKKNI